MLIRRSRYVHLVRIEDRRYVCLHAATGTGTVLEGHLAAVVEHFGEARDRDEATRELGERLMCPRDTVSDYVDRLTRREILTELTPSAEAAVLTYRLTPCPGRDPLERLRQLRRRHSTHPLAYPLVEPHQGPTKTVAS